MSKAAKNSEELNSPGVLVFLTQEKKFTCGKILGLRFTLPEVDDDVHPLQLWPLTVLTGYLIPLK